MRETNNNGSAQERIESDATGQWLAWPRKLSVPEIKHCSSSAGVINIRGFIYLVDHPLVPSVNISLVKKQANLLY